MAYVLDFDKQCLAISALVEGTSIRAVERMTGVHRDTIMRLGVRVGKACDVMMDETLRNLPCTDIQVDELWGFIGKKQKNVTPDAEDSDFVGDVWTFVAIDRETKLVPTFLCGKRDTAHTLQFVDDLRRRMKNRIQLSSDAMGAYKFAVDWTFGDRIDYGQIVKTYTSDESKGPRRYSPGKFVAATKTTIAGNPDESRICTSHVESQNLTARMHVRRLTRLTNAFSKKLGNFKAAIALHFAYVNFVKIHTTLKTTPAIAAGVSSRLWTVRDLVGLQTPEWTT